MMKRIHSIFNIICYVLVVITLTGLIVGYVNSQQYPNRKGIAVFNYTPMIVVSGSMLPAIDVNALVILEYCDISEVEEGDVIAYQFRDISVSHRIIEKRESNGEIILRTQGDNNDAPDYVETTRDTFIGKIVVICNPAAKIFKHVVNPDMTINKFKIIVLWIVIVGIVWLLSELYYLAIYIIKGYKWLSTKLVNREMDYTGHNLKADLLGLDISENYIALIDKYNNSEINDKDIKKLIAITLLVDKEFVLSGTGINTDNK